jgi:hypothetical protein
VQSCGKWSAINNGKGADNTEYMKHLWTHLLPGVQYESASLVEPQWTQSVYVGGINKKNKLFKLIVFVIPHMPECCHSAFPVPKPTQAASPAETWAADFGWDDEVLQIACALDVPKKKAIVELRHLVDLPSRHKILTAKSDVLKAIEQGLWKLNRLSLRYFTDVICWIAGMHSSFWLLFRHERFVLGAVFLS